MAQCSRSWCGGSAVGVEAAMIWDQHTSGPRSQSALGSPPLPTPETWMDTAGSVPSPAALCPSVCLEEVLCLPCRHP